MSPQKLSCPMYPYRLKLQYIIHNYRVKTSIDRGRATAFCDILTWVGGKYVFFVTCSQGKKYILIGNEKIFCNYGFLLQSQTLLLQIVITIHYLYKHIGFKVYGFFNPCDVPCSKILKLMFLYPCDFKYLCFIGCHYLLDCLFQMEPNDIYCIQNLHFSTLFPQLQVIGCSYSTRAITFDSIFFSNNEIETLIHFIIKYPNTGIIMLFHCIPPIIRYPNIA